MNDQKTQIVDKLKTANNILVTVSTNPTVDQLAACIAMTLLLNKYKKNTTAVFSGKIPSVIQFLHPKDSLQKSTDSLRDFIISLDKSKADKLRYKVEDDVVKIFITPYKTSITERDLHYSAGDFNVDVILALGVKHQQDLDNAITAHGRIFHDAVTLSMNTSPGGDFGIANWEDHEVSSLSELVAGLIEELDGSLLDSDISTALLTGIVAETSRFSNEKTHPQTLNVSSKLLAAGADQKLVNQELSSLIGTVVSLSAGDEIKPTGLHHELEHRNDVDDELVIDENGSLGSVSAPPNTGTTGETDDIAKLSENLDDTLKTQPDALVLDQPGADTPKEPDAVDPNVTDADSSNGTGNSDLSIDPTFAEELKLPDLAAKSPETPPENALPQVYSGDQPITPTDIFTPQVATASEPPTSVEDLLKMSGDSEVAPIETPTETPASENADSARQAVDSALGQSTSDLVFEETPVPVNTIQPEPSFTPAQEPVPPQIIPIAPNQPSYSNPATMTHYDMPAVPTHEPAPLGMSPADQAFTMPMPPISSTQVPQSSPQPSPTGQPPAGPPPPPLPPPMMPGSY